MRHSKVLTPLLTQGGDLGSTTDANMPGLYLLQWLKSDRALMMLFNDGTFQVNARTDCWLGQCFREGRQKKSDENLFSF